MTNENVNGDDMEKLVPQNDNEQMLVNALLAKCRGVDVEVKELGEWVLSNCAIFPNSTYRIKPKQTPLPIPDELWKLINPEFKFAAMDKNGFVYVYEASPIIAYNDRWVAENENYGSLKAFNINTDGIDWRLSLTKRPEGL